MTTPSATTRVARRHFLVLSAQASVVLSAAVLGACERKPKPKPQTMDTDQGGADARGPHTFGFLEPAEIATVGAILARFFPAGLDVGSPDAERARVIVFIDRELQKPHFRGLHRMMRAGIGFIERVAKREHNAPFHQLDADAQDAILRRFQLNQIKGLKFPQARFFDLLHTFALEGYWGSPDYGGNHQKVAWAWVGIDPSCGHLHDTSCD